MARDDWKTTYDTVARRKTKDDGIGGKYNSCKVLWTAIHGFEVHLFPSRARKHCAKFEPDEEPTEREQKAGHPEYKRCADGTDRAKDTRWCRKYPRADDTTDAGDRF